MLKTNPFNWSIDRGPGVVLRKRDHPLSAQNPFYDIGVYSFPFFSTDFLELFLDELDNFQSVFVDKFTVSYYVDSPGKFINNIGWEPMADLLLRSLFQPIATMLYPKDGAQLDSIHPFIMRYTGGEDHGLDMHRDNSDVSFTVCLGREFRGGGLSYCRLMGAPDHRKLQHRIYYHAGRCITHLGYHRHGIDPTTAGERVVLVMWTQNTAHRSTQEYIELIENLKGFAAEDGPPDQECLSWANDRDFGAFRRYPEGSEAWRGQGWCPPHSAEYSGFRPDTAAP